MEEGGEVKGDDKTHRWIIDPLDGTTNFLHGIPLFAISVALEREGQLVGGVIYNPISDELYMAERGKGAYVSSRGPQDRRLRVASRKTLADAVVATGIPHRGREGHPRFQRESQIVMAEVAGVRRTGAASIDLAWTAAGRFDGYWEHNLQPWDTAAGIIIIREAGGHATDADGGNDMFETGSIVVGNPTIHKSLLECIGKARAAA
jgi:myo-inositol-1(or 4)-monophosphatase